MLLNQCMQHVKLALRGTLFEKPSVHSPHITDLKTSGLFGDLACDLCTIQIGVAVIPAVSCVFLSVQGATTEKTPMIMS